MGEHETQLIAGAVDGELSAEESRAASALLARSPAAAELHAALLRDRERLKSIPRTPAPASLAAAIAEAIAQRPIIVPQVRPARRPRWVPAALAASVLAAVASGTYWFVAESAAPRLAKRQLLQLPTDQTRLVPRPAATPAPTELVPVEPPAVATTEPKPALPGTVVATQHEPANPMRPTEPAFDPERVLAAPVGSDVKAFDRVDLKLPLLATLSDFSREETQAALKANLARDPATRIDVFVKDTGKAAEALVASARKVNLNIQIETVAGERLKRRMPSAWWIYTESLTPDEIAKWLVETAAAEAALASPSEKTFGAIHAMPAGATDQKDSMSLAGVDLSKKAAASNGHISAKTLDQVTGSLQKGEAAKPGILLTYLPPLVRVPPQLSKDVKQFHELRGDRKPGTVPLVVVVRPAQ